MFFPMPEIELAVSVLGAILFCLLVVVDTHMIMKKLPREEYILGAMTLYLDFVNLFLFILKLAGQRRD